MTTTTVTKLELGAGTKSNRGRIGDDWATVDQSDLVEPHFVVDLQEGNWPFEDDSIDEIFASHFLEHLNPVQYLENFLPELYRICKHGAELNFRVPYLKSSRCFQDPTHSNLHACIENHYLYWDRGWRQTNNLMHYLPDVNFSVETAYEYNQDWLAHSDAKKEFDRKHYWDVIDDMLIRARCIKT